MLLHGISSGAASWQQQFASLGQNQRLIAWDAPGYGLSDGLNTTQPSAVDFATRLQALVDVLQLESFVLVGHSLGALIASAYASLQAARLKEGVCYWQMWLKVMGAAMLKSKSRCF